MPKFLNPDENPILPGIDGGGVVAVKDVDEETKSQQENVPEVKIKFADPDDGLEEKCGVCGDKGCTQCGWGRGNL